MGKGSSGGGSTSIIQPSLPNLPNQDQINSQAQNRLYAGNPWMNSPWRAMDFFPQQAPTQYLPQFNSQGAGQASGGTAFMPQQQMQQQPGVPGFSGFPLGPPPTTQLGAQALGQHITPGLLGMMNLLGMAGMGGTPPIQPQQNAAPQQQTQAAPKQKEA